MPTSTAVAAIGSLAGGKDSAVRLAIDAVSPKVIDAVRKLVDRRGVNVESSIQEYGDQIELMNAVTTALIGETSDAALLRRATAISDQVLAKSLLAGALNRIAGELESGALLEEHYLFFQSGYENAQTFYDRFRRTTDSVGRATLARIEAVPEVGTIGKEAERIIAAAQGDSTYAVDPAEWWRVASATVAAYDQLDDASSSRYLDLADQHELRRPVERRPVLHRRRSSARPWRRPSPTCSAGA